MDHWAAGLHACGSGAGWLLRLVAPAAWLTRQLSSAPAHWLSRCFPRCTSATTLPWRAPPVRRARSAGASGGLVVSCICCVLANAAATGGEGTARVCALPACLQSVLTWALSSSPPARTALPPARLPACRAIGAEVLIDDNPGYAQECAEAGIHVLLYDWQLGYPWSKTPGGGPTHDRITRWVLRCAALGGLRCARCAVWPPLRCTRGAVR